MVDNLVPPGRVDLLVKALRSTNPEEIIPTDLRVLYLIQGLISSLEQDGSAEAVEALADGSVACPFEESQRLAVMGLGRLANKGSLPALKKLFYLAIFFEKSDAIQEIHLNKFQDPDPTDQAVFNLLEGNLTDYEANDPDYQLLTQFYLNEIPERLGQRICLAAQLAGMNNWVLVTSIIKNIEKEGTEWLITQYPHFSEKEKKLLRQFLAEIGMEGSGAARDALCNIFIYQDDNIAGQLAQKYAFQPRDLQQRALFLFLCERWEEYQKIDFTQAFITSAYEAANPVLRKRLLNLSRYSGLTGWTQQLSTRSHMLWLGEMNDSDWESIILTLKTTGQFADLWRLAQAAPPIWSAKLITSLFEIRWDPFEEKQAADWDNLVIQALACLQNIPQIHLSKATRVSVDASNTLALSKDGSLAAIGGSKASILLINVSSGEISSLIKIPAAQIRSIIFQPDNKLLAAATGDNNIYVMELASGKKIKTLEGHTGHIRSLAISPDSHVLYSAGFDGTIRFWRFPEGPEVKKLSVNNIEWFRIGLGLMGEILISAGAGKNIQVWRLPEGILLRELEGHTGTISLLAIASSGSFAASYCKGQGIIVWNYTSGKILLKMAFGDEILTSLVIPPDEHFIISGNYKGEIDFWNISTGNRSCQLIGHNKPIIGLAVTPDGNQLISCSSDGIVCFWNLSIYMQVRLPIGASKWNDLKKIDDCLKQESFSNQDRPWVNFTRSLLYLRHQYDIAIDETPSIHIGEFDIVL